MTSNLDTRPARGDRARTRAYLIDFVPAMVAYCILLPLVIRFGGLDGASPSRFLWAMLPLLPALGVVRAVWRHLNRLDEYQLALATRSLAVGFGVMIVAAVTVGFLDMAGLELPAVPWIIYGLGMMGWVVGASLVSRSGRR